MKLSTQILSAFALVIGLSAADSYTNYNLSRKVESNKGFLSTSEEVIRNSSQLHKLIIQMQSGFRGFLLTDDNTFLQPYYRGLQLVPTLLEAEKKLVSNNAIQKKLLDEIGQNHQEWIIYAGSLINSRNQRLVSEQSKLEYDLLFENSLKKQVGKKLNDEITQMFYEFDRLEYNTRNERDASLLRSIKQTHTFSLVFLLLTVTVGAISTIYIVTLISRRIKSMVRLAENISKGEFNIVKDSANDELTGLSRSLNIMSDKLSQNIQELEKRNTELDKFAYVVSHDLKAPVRGIHNVIKWIEEDLGDQLSPEMKRYLDIIPQRTGRMENLINGLLDYARVSQKTDVSAVDTNELVNDLVDAIVPRHFRVKKENLPVLFTERLKLEQVFSNLISNAVKYSEGTTGEICITAKEFPRHYNFSVKDNGIGIEAEYHQKIFEIFQTLRERNQHESTGIGLSIVKKIIDEQNGNIKINSSLGQGAEFIFTWKK
jgi:signal transduction histidine kinase